MRTGITGKFGHPGHLVDKMEMARILIDRYAEQPTARLRVPLKLGAGDVGIYFLQSPPDKPLGTVKCWVDDNFEGGKMLHGTAEVEDVIASYVSLFHR
jgi:hypothetical protein